MQKNLIWIQARITKASDNKIIWQHKELTQKQKTNVQNLEVV